MGDVCSASFSGSGIGYDEAYSLGACTSSKFADISTGRIAPPSYPHVMYHGSTLRAPPKPRPTTPSLFGPACVGFASFENQDWGFCSRWSAPIETRDMYAFPTQEPPFVARVQGMAGCPVFHVPSSLEPLDAHPVGHKHEGSNIDISLAAPYPHDAAIIGTLRASSEMFRFQATLMAPTTIRQTTGEPPVTYLNRGQTYSVSIADTASATQRPKPPLYRTSIRVTFERNSAKNWQLWENSRGTTPGQGQGQGSTPQAVEYVGASDGSSAEVKPRLDSTSPDGFSVIWSQQPGGSAACTIDMRFHFLSTDFRLAQGVQGLASRLCAKTEIVSVQLPLGSISEICYCEVRLFRDRGAERRIARDKAKIARRIQQTIAELEAETNSKSGKLSESDAWGVTPGRRSGRRQLKMVALRRPTGQDLQLKLQATQELLNSAYSVSLLGLRGRERDDPHLHPLAPTHPPPGGCQTMASIRSELHPSALQHFPSLLDQRVEVHRPREARSSTSNLGVEPCGLQPGQTPSPERPLRQAIACFYILYQRSNNQAKEEHYQTVYLLERTARELMIRTATIYNFHPLCVQQMIHLNQRGLSIAVDDDVVSQIPEGQDMIMEITGVAAKHTSCGWDEAVDPPGGGDPAMAQPVISQVCLLRLIF